MAAVPRPDIKRIDPPHWWAGMQSDTLQLMVYGLDIAKADVALQPYAGVTLERTVVLDSPNYLLIYLNISGDVRPGTLKLQFKQESAAKRWITICWPGATAMVHSVASIRRMCCICLCPIALHMPSLKRM